MESWHVVGMPLEFRVHVCLLCTHCRQQAGCRLATSAGACKPPSRSFALTRALKKQPAHPGMDVWTVPEKRQKGWYLDLMAPNVKGPKYAWLDPSRLYCNKQGLQDCIEDLLEPFQGETIDLVAGIDAMGFILGSAIATSLGKGFLAIRKSGHLCVKTHSQDYTDYSGREKAMEVRTDVLKAGVRVLIVDQWVETGGTMKAAIKLVEQQGAVVVGVAAVCIENSEGGHWIRERYKHSHCVPSHLQPQFDQQSLQSFKAFQSTESL